MTALWLVLISLYGILLTIAIIIVQKRGYNDESLISTIDKSELPAVDRVNAIIEVAKLRQASLPWFERSISTAGVVAFFSMLIGTGFQAVKSNSDAIHAEQIERDVRELQLQKSDFDKAVAELAQSIMSQYQRTSFIDEAAIRVLRARLRFLERDGSIARDRMIEAFEITMIIGDYGAASRVLNGHMDLLDKTKSTDLIILVEYYYLTADSNSARALLKNLDAMLNDAPSSIRIRAIVLNALVNPGLQEDLVTQYATLLRIDREDAATRLDREKARMRNAAAEFRLR
jgi:hypothetical protein